MGQVDGVNPIHGPGGLEGLGYKPFQLVGVDHGFVFQEVVCAFPTSDLGYLLGVEKLDSFHYGRNTCCFVGETLTTGYLQNFGCGAG